MAELCTFANIKNFLSLEDAALTDYPALGVIKLSVKAAFDNYLGRYLESAERVEEFYVSGPTNILSLPAIPVTSVSSLVATMAGEEWTYETLNDDYFIVKSGLKVWPILKDAKIEITYTGGLTVVPSDIARAALLQTVYEYMGKDQVGAESMSTEGGTVSRPALGLLKVVKDILRKHMHPLKITDY